MSTKLETTLQIKDFRGINRFEDGTTTPPNEFYTIQNMHPKSRAELESLKGVLNQTPNALPGVGQFIHCDFLEQTFGDRKLIAFFKPSINNIAIPQVDATNFSTSGGSAQTLDLYVRYVGPGGAVSQIKVSAFSLQTSCTFTVPTGGSAPPDYVAEIQIYALFDTANPDNAAFCGALQRRNGSFAPNISFKSPYPYLAVIGDDAIPSAERIATSVSDFHCLPVKATLGNLQGGRTYFFALAPWVIDGTHLLGSNDVPILTDATLADTNGTIFSYTLPVGYNAIKLMMSGMPATITSPPAASPVTVDYFCLFMGQTPEDMQMVEVTSTSIGAPPDGRILPVPRSNLTGGTIQIMGHPYNSSLGVQMHKWNSISGGGVDQANWQTGDNLGASETRLYGVFRNIMMAAIEGGDLSDTQLMNNDLCQKMASSIYGAWVIPALPIVPNDCYQLLPCVPERNFAVPPFGTSEKTSGRTYGSFPISPNTQFSAFYQNADDLIETRNYANLMLCVNGLNVMFSTNGFNWKPICRSYKDTTTPNQLIPITKFIEILNDRVILSGGPGNFANTPGQVFYSESGVIYNFGSTSWNTISANKGANAVDSSPIVGLGLYSPDLSTVGPQAHLVIGKQASVLTWSGSTSDGSQLLDKVSGFASQRSLVRTNLGAIFVGRDNVYLMQSGTQLIPFGYEIEGIIKSIPNELLKYVNARYSENRTKIAYTLAVETVPTVGTIALTYSSGAGTYNDVFNRGYMIWAVCELNGITIASLVASRASFVNPTGLTDYEVDLSWPVVTFPAGATGQRYAIQFAVNSLTNFTTYGFIDAFDIGNNPVHTYVDNGIDVIGIVSGQPVLGPNFVPFLDNEVILELRYERGGIQKFYSGPHNLKFYQGQSATVDYNNEKSTRVSFIGADIYERDTGYSNDGSDIARKIVISRLGLEADHFWKVLRAVYAAVKVAANESFIVTLSAEDGSVLPISKTQSVTFSVAPRQLMQVLFDARFIGRVNTVTIENTSSNPLSFFDLTLTYQVLKRRLLNK